MNDNNINLSHDQNQSQADSNYSYNHQRNKKNQYIEMDSDSRSDDNIDHISMRKLASDVNNSLIDLDNIDKKKKKKKKKYQETDSNPELNESDKDQDINKDDISDSHIKIPTLEREIDYLKMFVEFLLLLSIYVIMSQPFIVSFASTYIQQLNPTDEGPTLTGVIIYGFILTIIFIVIRQIIYSRM